MQYYTPYTHVRTNTSVHARTHTHVRTRTYVHAIHARAYTHVRTLGLMQQSIFVVPNDDREYPSIMSSASSSQKKSPPPADAPRYCVACQDKYTGIFWDHHETPSHQLALREGAARMKSLTTAEKKNRLQTQIRLQTKISRIPDLYTDLSQPEDTRAGSDDGRFYAAFPDCVTSMDAERADVLSGMYDKMKALRALLVPSPSKSISATKIRDAKLGYATLVRQMAALMNCAAACTAHNGAAAVCFQLIEQQVRARIVGACAPLHQWRVVLDNSKGGAASVYCGKKQCCGDPTAAVGGLSLADFWMEVPALAQRALLGFAKDPVTLTEICNGWSKWLNSEIADTFRMLHTNAMLDKVRVWWRVCIVCWVCPLLFPSRGASVLLIAISVCC